MEMGTAKMAEDQLVIEYLEGQHKQRCRRLWEEAFPEDSKEFCDYYFREKIKDNRILALTENGQVQAMLHRNPYVVRARECCWQTDYVVGVATRRERRHRGYMRRLLLKMMGDMRQENMPFCFLMPAAEAIYRPFGFVFVYRQPGFVMGKEKGSGEPSVKGWIPEKEAEEPSVKGWIPEKVAADLSVKGLIPEVDSDEYRNRRIMAAEWMDRWLGRHYQLYVKRDEAYLKRLADEIASEDGTLDLLYDRDEIAALAGWWGRTKREQRLLYGDKPYVTMEDGLGKPAIMARIISPEVFVNVIRLKKDAGWSHGCILPLRLQDPLIPENDGLWLWHLERDRSWMERKAWSEEAVQGQESFLPPLSLTIEEMTAWLFGYEIMDAVRPYESVIEPLQGIFLDEVV